MPGLVYNYVSATQQDQISYSYQVNPPLTPMTFTKEFYMIGSTLVGSGPYTNQGTINMWNCDANTALLGAFVRYSVSGSTTGQLVVAKQSNALNSVTTACTSTFNMFGSADVLTSATLNTSTTLLQFQQGDAVGLRYGTPANLVPVGVVTMILQRY